MIENLLIYYFSGTGNALTAARWISENAEKKGIPSSIVSIETINHSIIPKLEGKTLAGILFPTHGFNAPWIVLKFFFRFPRIPNTQVFFINTRGGVNFGSIYLPGLSGIATWLPMFLFRLMGIKTRGVLPLDMPHSWTALGPPNSQLSSQLIMERCHNKVNELSEVVMAGGRFYSPSIWKSLLFDIAISPVAILYFIYGRFFLSKTLFASFNCNNCNVCKDNCPVGAIKMVGNRPYWSYACENCERCMNICPKKSIQAWNTRILIMVGILMVLGVWIWPFNYFIWLVLISLLFFPIYSLFHFALGVRWINKVFTYTSLTQVWKRYIAPGVKIQDLKKMVKNAENSLKR
jgi:ferredoxin